MPPINWKQVFGIASQIPIVRNAIGATLEEVERNPQFLRFVEKYQAMQFGAAQRGGVAKAECMICMFHKYGVEQGLNTLDAPPQHKCADRNGALFPDPSGRGRP